MDIALGTDRHLDMHLDITFGLQVVQRFSLVSILFREAFNHPYISFFHLLVNGVSVMYNVCEPKFSNRLTFSNIHSSSSHQIID